MRSGTEPRIHELLTVYVTVYFVQYLTKISYDAPCDFLFDSGSGTSLNATYAKVCQEASKESDT